MARHFDDSALDSVIKKKNFLKLVASPDMQGILAQIW